MHSSNNLMPETIRVIVIENHQILLWGLQKLINGQRPFMEVVGTASDHAEAVTQMPTVHPDVALLKYELAQVMSSDPLPVLLLRGSCRTLLLAEEVNDETLERSIRAGAHGLLSRDSAAEEVIKAIEKIYRGELWFGREVTGVAFSALRESHDGARSRPADDHLVGLTPRERKVLRAVIEHNTQSNKGLAKQLFISESTLRNHLSSIYQKLGVNNRLALYIYAQRRGLSWAGADDQQAGKSGHKFKSA
jgi:two-component system nitrate/nitrite response regulator NarL